MSLRNYLFILFALFILLVSGIQFYLIEHLRTQVSEEIGAKTNTLSNLAINSLQERFKGQFTLPTLTNPPANQISITIQNTPNKEVQLDKDFVMVTGDKTKTVTVTESSGAGRLLEQLAIDSPIQAVTGVQNMYALNLPRLDEQAVQTIISFDEKESAVDAYFYRLRNMLVAITVFALVLAYALAAVISRPLLKLSLGFERLRQGEFGAQLPEKGVKEMRDTLKMFNHTSTRLQELHAIENDYQQQQQLAELGEVARGLAHSLRNPLNTIGLGIEHLQQTDLTPQERSKITEDIQVKIQRLDKVIYHLLDLANYQEERKQPVNLVLVIEDIMMELSSSSKVRFEFAPHDDVVFCCSEHEVRAMFHVLLNNAVEASEPGSVVSITLHAIEAGNSQAHQGIELNVVDGGVGIAEAIREDLFKPHITTKPEGAGMGLFILKRLAHLHYRGRIELMNIKPRGCLARLQLFHDE
ncbi:HAMP domain-containing histidine kinase [Glaciecola sp. XM2]|uniref:ATP-binding protein n=1 Tax=Glaciecola sp. XM2 TaxID=1914931 RepID=UPI001BDECBDA|nr:HAMP domain-containing histidine kinase [Glaciecola sp. XM2]